MISMIPLRETLIGIIANITLTNPLEVDFHTE